MNGIYDNPKLATVSWTPGDVLTLRPEWTSDQAEAWLRDNEKYIQDRLVELGWDVIEALLPSKGQTP